jgi:hypothetical protein
MLHQIHPSFHFYEKIIFFPFFFQPFELDLSESTEESVRSEDSDEEEEMKNPTILRLPADSESIRNNIVDSEFDCEDTEPGYYADMENDCQVRQLTF